MPDTIPSLWPEQFRVDVQTPYTILRVQANLLSKVTRGILEGDVETEISKEKAQHRLVVIAPAYNGYRHTLITAIHDPDLPYPAEIRATALAEKVKREPNPLQIHGILGTFYDTVYPTANSDEQMQMLVKRALQSDETMATILSLIAKSNEAKASTPSGNGDESDRVNGGVEPRPGPS